MGVINFTGHGANVVGSLGSGSLVQDMPTGFQVNNTSGINEGSYVKCGDHTYTGDMSWSTWAYLDSGYATGGNTYPHICSKEGSWFIINYGQSLYGYLKDSAGNEFSDSGILNGQLTYNRWNHIGWTWNSTSGDMVFYLNGVSGASAATSCVTAAGDTSDEVCLGARKIGTQISFDGYIRDTRIYNSVLSATDMEKIFLDTYTGSTPLNHWQMEDGSSTTIDDIGSLNMDGTITGTSGYTAEGTGWDWNKSLYNLNQIGLGSVSGATTISGGTWNLRDSTYLDFDGSYPSDRDYVATANYAPTAGYDNISVSAWINLNEAGQSNPPILNRREGGVSNNYQFFLYGTDDKAAFTWWDTSEYGGGKTGSTALTMGEWHHIVATVDTAGGLLDFYFDGEPDGSYTGVTSGRMDNNTQPLEICKFGNADANAYNNTKLRDVRVYDTTLTPAQVSLMYKGQWNGSPDHWYLFNEGTGDTCVDNGALAKDGTRYNATWVNPTYTETDELTITAGGTLSAPRGIFSLDGNFTMDADTSIYTHNDGTFNPIGNCELYPADYDSSENARHIFYNVSHSAGTFYLERPSVIEGDYIKTGGDLIHYAKVTFGTTSSAGTLTVNSGQWKEYGYYGNPYLYAASSLFPVAITGSVSEPIDFDNVDNASRDPVTTNYYKWIDYQKDVTTGGGTTSGARFNLDGDCKFNSFTLSARDTLELDGERMECVGMFQNLANVKGDYSGEGTDRISTLYCGSFMGVSAGSVTDFGYTDVIITGLGGTNANDFWSFQSYGVNNAVINTADDPDSYPINMPGTRRMLSGDGDNLIIAQGGWRSDNFNVGGNLTIANGGKFDARTYDYTLNGDMIMSGGLIGKGALDFEEQGYVDLTDNSAWQFGTNDFTLEAWFRSDTDTGLNRTFIANGDASNNGFLLYMQGGGNIKLYVNNIAAVNAPGPYENDDVWHHVAAVRNGNVYSIYIDGKLIDQNTLAAQNLTHAGAASIGARDISASPDAYFDGQIAMIRVFKGTNGARTEKQIRADMFNNFASMVDDTDLLAMYQFDEMSGGYGTTIVNMEGTTALDGTLEPSGYAPNWAGPGGFTYDTSTLIFDKAGTCNLYGEQDGTSTSLGALTVTNGTTLETYCRDNDFEIYGTLVNSGTLNSNRNWQYKSSNMPIVGASSDLTVSNNYFYYFPQGVDATASGAATTYYILATAGGALTMQGDFTTTSHCYPYSDSEIYFNGYKGTLDNIRCAGSGNIVLDPGSGINFTNTRGFKQNDGGAESYITANGEVAYLATTDAGGPNTEGVYTNTDVVTSGTSQMSVSYWIKIPSDSNFFDASLLRAVWGFGSIFTGTPTVASHPGMWAHTVQSSWIKNDFYSYDDPADDDADFNRMHENATKPANWTGTGPYGWHHVCTTVAAGTAADTLKTYVDGVEVDSRQKSKEFLIVGSSQPGLAVHGSHIENNTSSYGTQMSISDFRIYKDITLTSGNTVTLASENPATSVSGAYADPDNALGATLWWKLNATASGTLDTTDSAGSNDGIAYGGAKSGFVTVTGTAGYGAINNPFQDMTLTNTYVSGMADIVVGETTQGANTASTLITKGTVVLD